MSTAENIQIKTVEETRDDYLRTYSNALIERGIANPLTSDGTEIFNKATALAQQIYVASATIPAAVDEALEDTAIQNLPRLAAMRGMGLRAAGGSAGDAIPTIAIAGSVLIPAGAELIDPLGLRYRVVLGGPTFSGQPVGIESLDTGAATNRAAGTTLTFTAPPLYVEPKATVGAKGLRFGVNAEDLEGLRARLLERMRHPPNGVNWPTYTEAAEGASAVQKAFAYPACNGPSTMHIAVVGAPTTASKLRDLDALTVSLRVAPLVQAETFSFVELVVTSVVNESVDVAIALAIPASPAASPPGPGGGWIDAIPFPVLASPGYVAVSNVVSSVEIEVSSDVAPVVGGSVSWVSTDDWTLRTALIESFTGTNPYAITLSTPFVSAGAVEIAVGDWIFPASERGEDYVARLFEAFSRLGPGEKTDIAGLLPFALRQPPPAESWPSEMKAPFLKSFAGDAAEISDFAYAYRSAITPTLPASISDAPSIFVPRQIGFYPLSD